MRYFVFRINLGRPRPEKKLALTELLRHLASLGLSYRQSAINPDQKQVILCFAYYTLYLSYLTISLQLSFLLQTNHLLPLPKSAVPESALGVLAKADSYFYRYCLLM